nr:MAG TPA: hypothetical protein [Caudoviricetes sp.]
MLNRSTRRICQVEAVLITDYTKLAKLIFAKF